MVARCSDQVFGERDGRRSTRAEAVAAVLGGTTIDWSLSDDIEQVPWEKLVFLASLATITCLFRANVREVISAPGGREAMEWGRSPSTPRLRRMKGTRRARPGWSSPGPD